MYYITIKVNYKINKNFEQIKLKCENIESYCDMTGGRAWKCGGGWLATNVVCVEGMVGGKEVDVEMDCLYTKEISPGTKHNKYYCDGTKRK